MYLNDLLITMHWIVQLETCVKPHIQLARIFRHNVDSVLYPFFWGACVCVCALLVSKIRLLGRARVALLILHSTSPHACSEFELGFGGV